MVEFLMRGRHSDKGSGTLACPACFSKKLRFIEKVGRDIEVWKCMTCNTTIRYCTTPWDPQGKGYSPDDAERDKLRALCTKEKQALGNMARADRRGITYLPGIGQFKVKRHKPRPKD